MRGGAAQEAVPGEAREQQVSLFNFLYPPVNLSLSQTKEAEENVKAFRSYVFGKEESWVLNSAVLPLAKDILQTGHNITHFTVVLYLHVAA